MDLEKVQAFQNTDTVTDWMCYRGIQYISGNCVGHMLVGCTCLSNYNDILWNFVKESCYQMTMLFLQCVTLLLVESNIR